MQQQYGQNYNNAPQPPYGAPPMPPAAPAPARGCFGSAWDDVVQSPGWFKKVALLGLIELVPIFNWVNVGYGLNWGREIVWGSRQPLHEKIVTGKNFTTGFYAFVISLVLGLIVGVVYGVLSAALTAGVQADLANGSTESLMRYARVSAGLSFIISLVTFFVQMFANLAAARVAVFDNLGQGFAFGKVWNGFTRKFGTLLCVYIVPALLTSAVVFVVMLFIVIPLATMMGVSAAGLVGSRYGYRATPSSVESSAGALILVLVLFSLVGAYVIGVVSSFSTLVVSRGLGHYIARFVPEWHGEAEAFLAGSRAVDGMYGQQQGAVGPQPGMYGQQGAVGPQPSAYAPQQGTFGQQPGAFGQPNAVGQQPGAFSPQQDAFGQQPVAPAFVGMPVPGTGAQQEPPQMDSAQPQAQDEQQSAYLGQPPIGAPSGSMFPESQASQAAPGMNESNAGASDYSQMQDDSSVHNLYDDTSVLTEQRPDRETFVQIDFGGVDGTQDDIVTADPKSFTSSQLVVGDDTQTGVLSEDEAPGAAVFAAPVVQGTLALKIERSNGDTCVISSFPTVLGKGKDADLRIEGNPTISRKHVRLLRDGEMFAAEDLASTNRTFIGNYALEPNTPTVLSDGDELKLGSEKLTVHVVRL